jgi:SAM-dependent methyltransferase
MDQVPKEWWKEFFTGVVVDMWLAAVPEQHTRAEVEFIRKMVRVEPPARLLDVPCGGGRHSLALAELGYRVTGVDGSAELLRAARAAEKKNLSVAFEHRDMRDLRWRGEFDAAVCFGNSFGYLDDEGNAAFLAAVRRTLRPGARFVLEYPMVLEARLPRFRERSWAEIGGIFFLEDEAYDPATGRVVTEYTFVRNGEVVKRRASHRSYPYREVRALLEAAGFIQVEAYGSLAGESYEWKSESLLLVATNPG